MPVKVSVIVPCYNIAPFVDQCMKCLTEQTMRDIEIICIDDKSSDDTLARLNEYAADDKRIKIIAQRRNSGVAAARNAGIDAARGQYIGFVDPDDLVDQNFFEVLYNLAAKHDADIAKGAVRHIKIDGTTEVLVENNRIKDAKYNFDKSFWSAIYRRKFLKQCDIRFPNGFLISEDLLFLMQAVHFANTVVTTDDVYYQYYRRENSADSNALSTPKVDSGIAAVRGMIEWARRPDVTSDERKHITQHAYSVACYLSGKDLRNSDIDKMVDLFVWLGANTGDGIDGIRPRVWRAMQHGDRFGLRATLFVKNTRWRLFGIIPLLKRSRISGWGTRYLAFDFIPVLTIIPGTNKTKIKSAGVTILTVKR